MKKIKTLIVASLMLLSISVSGITSFAVADTRKIAYAEELKAMAKSPAEYKYISEFKAEEELDAYDKIIIEANKQSSAKFMRDSEQMIISVEEYQRQINEIVERQQITDRLMEENKFRETNLIELPSLFTPMAAAASTQTKTLSKTTGHYKISAKCKSTGRFITVIGEPTVGLTFLGALFGHIVGPSTWNITYLDSSRTAGVKLTTYFYYDASRTKVKETAYVEFSYWKF